MGQDPRWLTPRELDAWLALVALTSAVPAALDAQLKRDSTLNHFEYMILAGASEPPGDGLLMSDLASFASGSLSRLSHAVTRLESRGLVVRQALPDDARHTRVVLTDSGWATVRAAAPGHVAEARRLVFDRLTPEQVDQLRTIASAITCAATGRSSPYFAGSDRT